jgi:hypothetical protein
VIGKRMEFVFLASMVLRLVGLAPDLKDCKTIRWGIVRHLTR